MKCPKCKNNDFIKSEDMNRPVMQMKTDKYPHATYRRYVCLQCSYKWISIEKFEREVKVNTIIEGKAKNKLMNIGL